MKQIDEYLIRLKDGVSGPAKVAGGALMRLISGFKGLAKRASGGLFSGFGKAAGFMSRTVSSFLGNVGASIAGFAAGAARDLAKGAIGFLDFGADSSRVLKASFGDAKSGAEAFRLMNKELATMGGGLEQAARFREIFATAGRLGLSPQEADMIARFESDLVGLGNSAQDATGLVDRLFKAAGTGQLTTRTIGELGQAGLGSREDIESGIAKRMGISLEQLRKMGEDEILPFGHVMNELVQRAVAKSKRGLGEVGAEVGSHTFGGIADDIKGAFLGSVTQALEDSGASTRLIGAAGEVGKKISAAIAGPQAQAEITKLLDSFTRWISSISEADIKSFVRDLKDIAGALADITGAIGPLVSALGTLAKGFSVVANPLDSIFEFVDMGANADALDAYADRIGRDLDKGIATGLDRTGGAEKAAGRKAMGVAGASAQELEIKSPSRIFFEQGEEIDAGLAEGMTYNDLALQAAEDVARGATRASNTVISRSKPGMASMAVAAGESIAGNSSRATSMGDVAVTINVTGSDNARETAEHVYITFEERMGVYLDRLLQGAGG